MSPLCVHSGGAATIPRLTIVPAVGVPTPFSGAAAAALHCWQARPGMIITVVDADEMMWRARLVELNEYGGILLPFSRSSRSLESPLQLTVYQALPEKERFELVLEKLTELGVTRIVPCVSLRSSTIAERDAKQPKSHRWPEVIRRAAVQCRRGMIPELSPCLNLDTVCTDADDADLRLMLYEGEEVSSLKTVLAAGGFKKVALLVGPEGGFTGEEVAFVRARRFQPVSFGPRILRTETAAIAAVAALQYALGDLV